MTRRLLLALLICCWTAVASATVPVTLGEEGHQALGRQLALLDDPNGTMDVEAVRTADAAGGFRPVLAEVQGLGYRPGATWVRLAILNPTATRQERWLEFARPMHNSAVLYRVAADGAVVRLDNGARVPVAQRPLASRNLLFPLTLEAGETQTAYLRLASRTATVVDLHLWRPIAYADRLERFMALKYLGVEIDAKLAIIESSGTHLLRLIDQVLDFGRGEARSVVLRLEPTSIESLVAHLADSGRLLAAEGDNRFSIELVGDVPAIVEADDHQLTQVLQNLISNACKYTKNGRVSLRIARQAVVTEVLPATWASALHRIEFSVADTGIGIAPEDQARIFEPFSRIFYGSKRQPGVGLGLTIARQLVQAMGGGIGLESVPGQGSRFFFSLVLREVVEEGGQHQNTLPARIVGHKGPARTLLVADDIAENRMFLQDFCRFWGFNVLTAADGAEALSICRLADPPVDAVLIDQFMPEVSGWVFLQTVRESPILSRLPVILVSAARPNRPTSFPVGMDFDHVMLKPICQDELAEFLARQLDIEWIWEQPVAIESARRSDRVHAGRYPPKEQLETFRDLLTLGRVVALQRWADSLEQAFPACAWFAGQVRSLCRAVDLIGLQALLDQAEGNIAVSAAAER